MLCTLSELCYLKKCTILLKCFEREVLRVSLFDINDLCSPHEVLQLSWRKVSDDRKSDTSGTYSTSRLAKPRRSRIWQAEGISSEGESAHNAFASCPNMLITAHGENGTPLGYRYLWASLCAILMKKLEGISGP